MRYLFSAAIAVCLMIVAAPLAFADSSAVPVASILDVVRPYITEIVGVIIAAVVAYLLKTISAWTGIRVEANHRDALQSALENAGRVALGHLEAIAADRVVDVGHPALNEGLLYVLHSVPDAVAYFNLSPEHIMELIRPKLIPKVG